MHVATIVTVLCFALPAETPESSQVQTGTMLFSRGDCLAVKVFTGSSVTHVAIVCHEPEGFYVYDAVPATGVRRQTLDEYLKTIAPDEVRVAHPARSMTEAESKQLQEYLNSQIGKPYAVLHHSTGQRCEGVHCAEYLTDSLISIGWLTAKSPPRVSPGSLLEGVTQSKIYELGPTWSVAREEPPPQIGRNCCEQMWIDTKECCQGCCNKLSRIFLCR